MDTQDTDKRQHRIQRSGWLRAAVLGANDGIVSVASLVAGVAAAGSAQSDIVIAGLAGWVAGAMSMAAGEYVSVRSQYDIEKADLKNVQRALAEQPDRQLRALTKVYQERGLMPELAAQVAEQMTAHDALEAHARDEIGISSALSAQPMQAAFVSAGTFTIGAIVPVIVAAIVPLAWVIWAVPCVAVLLLLLLGYLGAMAGGAPRWQGALRVCLWGIAAMILTAAVGGIFGVQV